MRTLLVLPLLAGCTWVAEAQYDDRADELEEARTEFLPGSDEVQFMIADGGKFYWYYLDGPLDTRTMKSYEPATNSTVEIMLGPADQRPQVMTVEEDFRFSNDLIVECDGSSPSAWDARSGALVQTLTGPAATGATGTCAVDGRTVYFIANIDSKMQVFRWTPGPSGMNAPIMDLMAAGVGDGGVNGFSVTGNTMFYVEAARAWRIDLSTLTAKFLNNEDVPAASDIISDERSAMFDGPDGVQYIPLDDPNPAPRSFDAMIANGGYRLNSSKGDIHKIADDGAYTFYKRYVIYRGQSGIFAYGLDTGKVTDILLDRGTGFDATTVYRGASITSDGALFVQHRNNSGSEERPVYRVDLGARLP